MRAVTIGPFVIVLMDGPDDYTAREHQNSAIRRAYKKYLKDWGKGTHGDMTGVYYLQVALVDEMIEFTAVYEVGGSL